MELLRSSELDEIILINAATEYIQHSFSVMGKPIRLFLQYFDAYTLAEAPRLLVVLNALRKCNIDMCNQTDMSCLLIEDFLYELRLALKNVERSCLFDEHIILDNGWYSQFVKYTCNYLNRFWAENGDVERMTNTGIINILDVSQSKHSEWQKQRKTGPNLPTYIARHALALGDVPLLDICKKIR
jgi:hypothetical protein